MAFVILATAAVVWSWVRDRARKHRVRYFYAGRHHEPPQGPDFNPWGRAGPLAVVQAGARAVLAPRPQTARGVAPVAPLAAWRWTAPLLTPGAAVRTV